MSNIEISKKLISLLPNQEKSSFFFESFFFNTSYFLIFFFLFYIIFFMIFFSFYNNITFFLNQDNIKYYLDLTRVALSQVILVFFLVYFYLFTFTDFSFSLNFSWDGFLDSNIFHLFCFFILTLFFVVFLLTWFYFFKGKYKIDILLLLWLCFFSFLLLIFSHNLIITYISLEILAICSYALIASQYSSSLSLEASLKYLILAAISSGIFVLGIFFFYFELASFDLYEFFYLMTANSFSNGSFFFIMLSFFLMITGIFFKIGLAPFHFWMPDVYQGASLPITLFFAVLPKFVYIIVFSKFLFLLNLFSFISFDLFFFEYFFIFIACFSLMVGTLGALNQIKIKRFLAYSTMSHMSYILFSLSFITSLENFLVIFFYIISYIILLFGIFTILLCFHKLKIFHTISSFKFSSFNTQWFFLFFIWISFFLSLAGMPPFLGFFSKFLIFKIILKTPYLFMVFFISFFSVISLFYYLRFIIFSFFMPAIYKNNNSWFIFNRSFLTLFFVFIYCFLINCFFFLDLDFFLNFLNTILKLDSNFSFFL